MQFSNSNNIRICMSDIANPTVRVVCLQFLDNLKISYLYTYRDFSSLTYVGVGVVNIEKTLTTLSIDFLSYISLYTATHSSFI